MRGKEIRFDNIEQKASTPISKINGKTSQSKFSNWGQHLPWNSAAVSSLVYTCTYPCHECLTPIWNSAPDLLPVFLTVNSERHATPRRTDVACNSQHYRALPPRGRLAAAGHELLSPRSTRGCLDACARWQRLCPGLSLAREGRGRKQVYVSLLVRDGASTSQTDILRLFSSVSPLHRLRIASPWRTQKLKACQAPSPLTWRRASGSICAGSSLKPRIASAT